MCWLGSGQSDHSSSWDWVGFKIPSNQPKPFCDIMIISVYLVFFFQNFRKKRRPICFRWKMQQPEHSSFHHNQNANVTILINMINIAWKTTLAHCMFINIYSINLMAYQTNSQKLINHRFIFFLYFSISLYFCE